MIVLTPEEMAELDQKTIENGFPSLLLMETAGRGIAEVIKEKYGRNEKILILAGSGNNGGDGLVVARLLDIWNYNVKIIIVGEKEKLNSDPLKNYKTCKLRDIELQFFNSHNEFKELKETISNSDVIVDSLLGTGLSGDLREPFLNIVSLINNSEKEVVAVDIPTGIDGGTGKVMGKAVKAETTVTMAFSKVGHYIYPGYRHTGELVTVDLGIPAKYVDKDKYNHHNLTLKEAEELLPKRPQNGHKGTFGKVLVVGGSFGYEGAPALTGESALKMGTGLVKLLVPEKINNTVSSYCKELTSGYLSINKVEEEIDKFDVIALGPGLGVGKKQEKIVSYILNNSSVPVVVDADGLNNLSLKELKRANCEVVLTPHPGEFSRLIDKSIKEIQVNRVKYIREFAKKYDTNILLKGANTLIADKTGEIYINITGNDGLATAGSGDVLTGIISSLSGQQLSLYKSAVLGAFMHGLAGDIGTQEVGSYSLLAGNITENIPPAISKIIRGC
ncbi:MAG: NAD(P)H-hydrate dehydratase [Halanaerobiales bacterium]